MRQNPGHFSPSLERARIWRSRGLFLFLSEGCEKIGEYPAILWEIMGCMGLLRRKPSTIEDSMDWLDDHGIDHMRFFLQIFPFNKFFDREIRGTVVMLMGI